VGVLYIEGRVKGLSGKHKNVKFFVDSGATYSLLPQSVWKAMGLKPKRKVSFTLADGTTVESDLRSLCCFSPRRGSHASNSGGKIRRSLVRGRYIRNPGSGV